MKEDSQNQTKAVGSTNASQPFFQPEGSENSFFSKRVKVAEPIQKKNAALPEDLQAKMERAFGQDFSRVNIHKASPMAVQLNARAFTKGDSVHFAPGEFNPNAEAGRKLIGHEFTHVAQQRGGAVKPTRLMGKGLPLNDDRGLEREADDFGKRAIKGESITKYQSSSLGIRNNLRVAQAKSDVLQRAVNTFGGSWDTDEYKLRQDEVNGTKYAAKEGIRGVDIKLKFTPNSDADAELIGITQTAQSTSGGKHPFIDGDPSREKRAISSGTEKGTMIDRADGYNNPIYAVNSQPSTRLDDTSTSSSWGQHGWSSTSKTPPTKDATLIDKPTLLDASKDSQQIFESTALALRGNQQGTYYGSVQWGWKTDAKGKHTIVPFKKVREGVPSGKFMRAATVWNTAKDSTGADTIDLPVQWTGTIQNTPLAALRSGQSRASRILADLPRGTNLTVLNDTSNWHYVQLDKDQAGIVFNRHGLAAVLTGDVIRGYVSKELINKDADYR